MEKLVILKDLKSPYLEIAMLEAAAQEGCDFYDEGKIRIDCLFAFDKTEFGHRFWRYVADGHIPEVLA